jgi:hypothetical protein
MRKSSKGTTCRPSNLFMVGVEDHGWESVAVPANCAGPEKAAAGLTRERPSETSSGAGDVL